MASFTVLIFSASSSGISRSNASSNCITSSTTSRESAPRSSWKLAPGVTSASSTCNCSTMICFTFSSTAMLCFSSYFVKTQESHRACSPLPFRLPTITARGRERQPLQEKNCAWPRNFKFTGRVGVCKGVEKQGIGNQEWRIGNRLHLADKCTDAQGDWGEFILRDLLEKAGLHEGEQYSFQQSFSGLESEDGEKKRSARTDVIVFLPGGRNLVIDSKVSLTAYSDSVNATGESERSAALKLHLANVRAHMIGLSKAGYHRLPGIEAPDFVVMFVPIEPAFLIALQSDSELWADAYKQGILLVGPTTLLYVIRIVNVLWQQELQARSVQDVMNRGAELYDKFVGFVSDLEAVGRSLRSADQCYATAMRKLSEGRGNLVRQVEMLKQLGIRTSKSIPQSLLDAASVEEPGLALAAQAEEDSEVNVPQDAD